jgi:hypothetical protein
MSYLSEEQQSAIIAALCEGVSIRAVERLTGHHRDSVMRLGAKVGEGCAVLHGRLMVNLHVSRVELDEVWSFIKKKRRNVGADDPDTVGDQFIYLAMDSTALKPFYRRSASAGQMPRSVIWPGGGTVCPSLAAKECRAVSVDGFKLPAASGSSDAHNLRCSAQHSRSGGLHGNSSRFSHE